MLHRESMLETAIAQEVNGGKSEESVKLNKFSLTTNKQAHVTLL